jgi:hypothetical protein
VSKLGGGKRLAEVAVERKPEISPALESAIREFVRGELAWLALFLHNKYGLTLKETKKLLREMLDVSI